MFPTLVTHANVPQHPVFFDEHEKPVAPYMPYSNPSDTETELDEAMSS